MCLCFGIKLLSVPGVTLSSDATVCYITQKMSLRFHIITTKIKRRVFTSVKQACHSSACLHRKWHIDFTSTTSFCFMTSKVIYWLHFYLSLFFEFIFHLLSFLFWIWVVGRKLSAELPQCIIHVVYTCFVLSATSHCHQRIDFALYFFLLYGQNTLNSTYT